jgi:hypothetical protein
VRATVQVRGQLCGQLEDGAVRLVEEGRVGARLADAVASTAASASLAPSRPSFTRRTVPSCSRPHSERECRYHTHCKLFSLRPDRRCQLAAR